MPLLFTERYWVGAADTINEREWLWMTSKTTFTYNNWLPGNPDNGYGGNENCLEINYAGHWNDAECKELKQYICEMEAEYVPYMSRNMRFLTMWYRYTRSLIRAFAFRLNIL